MTDTNSQPLLQTMLDRLIASLANGPSLNARPHSSRQRIDLVALDRLADRKASEVIPELLSGAGKIRIAANVPAAAAPEADDATSEHRRAYEAYEQQSSTLRRLRAIAEDANDYENETGAHVLHIGFPLLSLPPGSMAIKGVARRILAPIAFIPVNLSLSRGFSSSVTLEVRGEGADLVAPNVACLAWLARLTGVQAPELDEDERGLKPWEELLELIRNVCAMTRLPVPEQMADVGQLSHLELVSAPRSQDEQGDARIISSAVLGLYPVSNQSLLRDTQALLDGEPFDGPLKSFLSVDLGLGSPKESAPPELGSAGKVFAQERFVTHADPTQSRAISLSRSAMGLVIHGPPGTGKSQTITNIIGDHLSRGERVLFVCDKRTALDVVMNRLEAMGLGSLCAVIHDPQRDQRGLYRSVREQLESLAATRPGVGSDAQINQVDGELQHLHERLSGIHAGLMRRPGELDDSFHELVGRWLATGATDIAVPRKLIAPETLKDVEPAVHEVSAILARALEAGYADSPWRQAAGIALGDYIATPMAEVRKAIAEVCGAAELVDSHAIVPELRLPALDLEQTAARRRALAEVLRRVYAVVAHRTLQEWLGLDSGQLAQRRAEADAIKHQSELMEQAPIDTELLAGLAGTLPAIPVVQRQLADLGEYLQSTTSVFGFFAFSRKRAARAALREYGLPLSPANARRLDGFLKALRIRLALLDGFRLAGSPEQNACPADAALAHQATIVQDLSTLCEMLAEEPVLLPLARTASGAEGQAKLCSDLEVSGKRAEALKELLHRVRESRLFAERFVQELDDAARAGGSVTASLRGLEQTLPQLEAVLRTRHDLERLPPSLGPATAWLLQEECGAADGIAALRREAIAVQISERLKNSPELLSFDRAQLQSMLDRYAELENHKRSLVQRVVQGTWVMRQRERLLAATGTRLNGEGAELRRRLSTHGVHSMRLRQLIAHEAREALFDLRPAWMASPETVAQIFPRQAMFDVVIFDEASQCRLEEALPVLLRAKRVVIAGDPQQLPPSRFFETAITISEAEEPETDQQFFETQQGEIEDLLGAALNLEIEEAYLDVHYRSRNADLIEFSNLHFYNSRLQPIPAHPANRARHAPLTLYRVEGVYEDRCNKAEAQRVCGIVRDLLRRAEPPSIGIACFNLQQRDLVLETLDELASTDHEFGRAVSTARTLRRGGSFEGLFVKNLENVQGDERDHIIISTTYGPDAQGRFYRRFGPLGRAGGGRRLNVLVTRARHEVHLVSSIPPAAYRTLEPIPAGQTAAGPWLLFAYLQYAEQLADAYSAHKPSEKDAPGMQERLVYRTGTPSSLAEEIGQRLLAQHRQGSHVYWGNDGFCVDVALQDPADPEGVTVGALCDLNRFAHAADPVEWELFRTQILLSQGWKLHRIWSPSVFRDADTELAAMMDAHAKAAKA